MSNERKWTPGPWRADVNDDGGFMIQPHGSSDPFVLCSRTDWISRREMSIANAHLIAAAPDLYEACQVALDAFEHMRAIDWSILERALAKARGEQP